MKQFLLNASGLVTAIFLIPRGIYTRMACGEGGRIMQGQEWQLLRNFSKPL